MDRQGFICDGNLLYARRGDNQRCNNRRGNDQRGGWQADWLSSLRQL